MKKSNNKGFTIIEVVLVLAIAGLIFLIVFLALPQLQRSRRDTQRKNDAGRILAQLENYAGNNNGNYPENLTEMNDFIARYLTANGDVFKDPQGANYTLSYVNTQPGAIGTLSYQDGYKCNGEAMAAGNDRDIAVLMPLEQGVSGTTPTTFYCQDNL